MYIERTGILGRGGHGHAGGRGRPSAHPGGRRAGFIAERAHIAVSHGPSPAQIAANNARINANNTRLSALQASVTGLWNAVGPVNSQSRQTLLGKLQNIVGSAGNLGDTYGVSGNILNSINGLKTSAQNLLNGINGDFATNLNAATYWLNNFSTLPNALTVGQDWAQNAINISIKNQNSGQIVQAASIYQALADMPTILKATSDAQNAVRQANAAVSQTDSIVKTANVSIASANANVTTLQSQIKSLVQTAQQKQQAYDLTVMKTAMQNAMATQANADLVVLTKQKVMYENTIAGLNSTISSLKGSNATLQKSSQSQGASSAMSIGASLLGLMVL